MGSRNPGGLYKRKPMQFVRSDEVWHRGDAVRTLSVIYWNSYRRMDKACNSYIIKLLIGYKLYISICDAL